MTEIGAALLALEYLLHSRAQDLTHKNSFTCEGIA